ncbi:LysR substrate-binding domain-containing protein [Subtercola frigoramans]|uniref:DNA-binding transcriptional LysR family regulator n=1 Tax=Subtercola frigoramans TaxID=120298 RepID=A0ABS2L7K6_9MICO|nr:LysR substrate-binding domain-containing protein [Subtercola frigoramans]MBM7473095.1 DNA-binding transcriptional LysR family regulator [Subtercola frigoramans]
MELRHLKAFLAVAEELHFGRAAERLHMAQPPLSQLIRKLETHLGTPLFERSTRAVRLTSAGVALVGPAKAAVDAANDAERAARAGGRGEYGRVTIGFVGATSRELMPLLMRGVRAAYPDIELVFAGQVYTSTAFTQVAERKLDIGFVLIPTTFPGLRYRALEEETLYAVLPTDHPLAERESIEVGELSQDVFVSFPSDTGSFVRTVMLEVCHDAGFSPRIVLAAPDSYMIHAFVAAGAGVTITISSCLHIQQPGVVYVPLRGIQQRYQSALAWHEENSSAAVHAVLRVADSVLPRPEHPLSPVPQVVQRL